MRHLNTQFTKFKPNHTTQAIFSITTFLACPNFLFPHAYSTAAVSLGSYNFSVLLSLLLLLLGLLYSPYRNRLNGGCLLIPKEQFAA